MHCAEKNFAGLVVFLFDIGFNVIGQRSIAGFVALDDFAGGFVDDDHVIVFVKDFHLYIMMSAWRDGRRNLVQNRSAERLKTNLLSSYVSPSA